MAPNLEISTGGKRLYVRGGELVYERKKLVRTDEKIIPVNAISSINVTTESNLRLLIAGGVLAVFGLMFMAELGAGVGSFMLLLAAGAFGMWYLTRSVKLHVASPTDAIEFTCRAKLRDRLTQLANHVRRTAGQV